MNWKTSNQCRAQDWAAITPDHWAMTIRQPPANLRPWVQNFMFYSNAFSSSFSQLLATWCPSLCLWWCTQVSTSLLLALSSSVTGGGKCGTCRHEQFAWHFKFELWVSNQLCFSILLVFLYTTLHHFLCIWLDESGVYQVIYSYYVKIVCTKLVYCLNVEYILPILRI